MSSKNSLLRTTLPSGLASALAALITFSVAQAAPIVAGTTAEQPSLSPAHGPEASSMSGPLTGVTAAKVVTSATSVPPLIINIDGRVVESDPGPILDRGVVFVPLRGVLENMGAVVEFSPQDKKIVVVQGERKVSMRLGEPNALVGSTILPMAPPKIIMGRAFVPLRVLAELFGYRVAWLANVNTVAIYSEAGKVLATADHRAALAAVGPLGVGLDFRGVPATEISSLLEAAKSSGASMVKVNFEWEIFQPTQDSDFQWSFFDKVIKEARERNLLIVGVLGGSTQWASVSSSTEERDWRRSPPRDSQFPAWSNYVRRTVGRYKNDVHAWQIWQNPAASNFRAMARSYRRISVLAVEAARQSDPKAIIHAAEPGGVELDFIHDLERNGLTPKLDGIAVYPVSQWQPGAVNPSESFLLPYATLQEQVKLKDGKHRDYWVGGLGYPTLEVPGVSAPSPTLSTAVLTDSAAVPPLKPVADAPPGKRPVTIKSGLLDTFSPMAQASYLVRSISLSLASGSGKVFWTRLRDEYNPFPLQPINPEAGTGLLRADGTPRPAYEAFRHLSQSLGGKTFVGHLALSPQLVALLFSDQDSSTVVAWSPSGGAKLALTSSGVDPRMPDATWVSTRPDSKVVDLLGVRLTDSDAVLELTDKPVFIQRVAYESVRQATERKQEGSLRMQSAGPGFADHTEVVATFTKEGGEDGLFWRRYEDFGGVAREFVPRGDRFGLATESQRDIFDLLSSRPFIYLDVADDFLYFNRNVPVRVTVEAYRPPPPPAGDTSPFATGAGFRVEYDSVSGFKSTPWLEVKPGGGWEKYSFDIKDASFSNGEGYDLLINANGSKSDLVFGSVTVRRLVPGTTPDPAPAPAPAAADPVPAPAASTSVPVPVPAPGP